jgi:hypothetical protein
MSEGLRYAYPVPKPGDYGALFLALDRAECISRETADMLSARVGTDEPLVAR